MAKRRFEERTSYRTGLIIEAAGIFLLFFALLYVSRIVDESELGWPDYFSFVVVGMGLFSLIAGASGALPAFYASELSMGTLEQMLISRTSLPTLLTAVVLVRAAGAMARMFLYLCLGLFLGVSFEIRGLIAVVMIVPIAVLAGSAVGLVSTGLELITRRVRGTAFLTGGTAAVLGGVYFPVDLFPDWIRYIAFLIPATHAVEAGRRILIFGEIPAGPAAALAALAALYLPVGIALFILGMRKAKRDGTLSSL